MKYFLLLLILSQSALAVSLPAVVRNKLDRASEEAVELQDLVSDKAFDGKFFKIVIGKGEEPVPFTADKDILLKAATAYHHLTIARNYFANHLKSEHVIKMPKMTIRIEHKNQFSELGHFAHDNLDPEYNNALTIPAGKGLRGKEWNIEIWFRPKKKVHLNDLKVNNLAQAEFKQLMKGFRNQIHMQSLQRFLANTITAMTNEESTTDPLSTTNLIRTVGSSLIMEFGYQFIEPISRATSRKWYWLDTALVPEIIYHEFSHAALSDHLVLSHSTAIIEGMADFFAGQIANSPKLAKHIKKYNTFNGKNAKRKQSYVIQFEMTDYANTDFVFGMLWELQNILGKQKGEAFMFELRKKLTTNSTIRGQLVEGILKTCADNCQQPFNDKIRILKALNLRGI